MLAWYRQNRRDLPWRRTRDPYAIWVSEMMLQQTQVDTVLPYFERWMGRFPTVEALAQADDQEVLALWQGLGYYRRCRALLEGARKVVANGMPETAETWLQIPGVGPYTAAAIASIAFDEPVAVVDGNVERVYARLTGSRSTGGALKKEAWAWATKNLFVDAPGDWNQTLMEFGATLCTPRAPKCPTCPISTLCTARQSWTVDELPVPRRPGKTVQLTHVVWVPVFRDRVGIRQIPTGAWWEGMWEFPREDATEDPDAAMERLRSLLSGAWPEELGSFRHAVTNNRITVQASLVRLDNPVPDLEWLTIAELAERAMPSPQRRVLRMARPYIG